MAEFIEREAALASIRHEDPAFAYAIMRIPAADVRPRWIPVTERLPDVGKEVLCFCRANICFVLGWDGNHWHEGADRYYMSGFVTHWMPLPPAPKEET